MKLNLKRIAVSMIKRAAKRLKAAARVYKKQPAAYGMKPLSGLTWLHWPKNTFQAKRKGSMNTIERLWRHRMQWGDTPENTVRSRQHIRKMRRETWRNLGRV